MQNRRMIAALFAAMAVFYLWLLIAQRIWPPQPATQPAPATSTAPAEPAATRPASGPMAAPVSAPTAPSSMPAAATQPSTGSVTVKGGAAEGTIVLGNAQADSPYPLEVEISPLGASVRMVSLRGYWETVQKKMPYRLLDAVEIDGRTLCSFSTTKVRIDNLKLDVPLDGVVWAVSPASTGDQKILTATVEQGGQALARVTKTYRLPREAIDSLRFDLDVSLKVENLSGQPIRIILEQQGPVGFRKEDLRSEDRKVIGATWRETGGIAYTGHTPGQAQKGRLRLTADEDTTRVAWAAGTNKYFTCIMAPAGRTGVQAAPLFATVDGLELISADAETKAGLGGLTFQFVTRPIDIAPGASTDVAFACYLGPKSKRAFQGVPEYQRLNYYDVIKDSFYACAPAWLVAVMMKLLGFFHSIWPHNYGIAIIVLVLVVRAILHPITKKSQVNMVKMQKQMSVLQPKVEAVKQKYANDKVAMNQAMMEVYREAGVNPAGQFLNCLPLMLQIPIWGALWTALSSTIEMRHAPFDGWWIRDLAGPDAIYTFAAPITGIPLVNWLTGPITSINILPILLGVSQLLQTKYMPRGNPGTQASGNPDQLEQQRKMMMWMSGLFVLMLYGAPSGLNLYIMASNFFGILEQWRIRQHIAEEEKKQADQPLRPKPGEPRKPSWMERKWKDLAKQVEEAKKLESQRDKKGKPKG